MNERIERLENIALAICKEMLKHENSWMGWADPFREFIGELEPKPTATMNRDEFELHMAKKGICIHGGY